MNDNEKKSVAFNLHAVGEVESCRQGTDKKTGKPIFWLSLICKGPVGAPSTIVTVLAHKAYPVGKIADVPVRAWGYLLREVYGN